MTFLLAVGERPPKCPGEAGVTARRDGHPTAGAERTATHSPGSTPGVGATDHEQETRVSIHEAHRALVEARTATEHELADVQARLARIITALAALEPDAPAAPPPAAPAAAAPAKRPARTGKTRNEEPERKPRSTVDYPAIAAWINQSKQDGSYSDKALAAHFGVTLSAARNYVTKCRKLGLLRAPKSSSSAATTTPAAATPVSAAGPATPKVYRCTECEFECGATKDMAHHTITRHQRGPLLDERRAAA